VCGDQAAEQKKLDYMPELVYNFIVGGDFHGPEVANTYRFGRYWQFDGLTHTRREAVIA
jgi:hypothetical protein